MNTIKIASRGFFKKGRNNVIKIISLGVGLAVGLILITKVNFEMNFDDFYPDNERIYNIQSSIGRKNEDSKSYGTVSGAIAPGMKDNMPEVEAATRFTSIGGTDAVFFTVDDQKRLTGSFVLADSCLFDVLPRPVVEGDIKKTLSQPMYVIVSSAIAEKLGGNAIGRQIQMDAYPGRVLTIGAVFEAIPENSAYKYDIAISMASVGQFMWDKSPVNWIGNDRYMGYVKLKKGTDPLSLAPGIRHMQEKYQNIQEIEQQQGWKLSYSLISLTSLHSELPAVKRIALIVSIIAFALIFTAVLNYVLIVITTLVGCSKEIAVYKCYGATEKNITSLMFCETLFHLFLSLVLASVLIFCFRATIEDILDTSLFALFTPQALLISFCICAFVFLIAAVIPAYMLSRIPVATVFRSFAKTRRAWKLVLLFVQFVSATFLFTLLVIVSKQYTMMMDDNPGYSYENTLYISLSGTKASDRKVAIEELKRLPQVDMVASGSTLPFENMAGNNISLPEEERDLFNIADLYNADENYFPLLGIPVIEGRGFQKGDNQNTMMVSKSFIEKMKLQAGWQDGVVGKDVLVSEHGLSRIVGVFPDIRISSITNPDTRSSVIFYSPEPASGLIIKLNSLNGENIEIVNSALKKSSPDKDIVLLPYSDSMVKLYDGERRFKDAIMIGGIITMLITLIGLIGYINNEIVRRTSEITVRKINGATLWNIIRLFVQDILYIAPLALLIGCVGAAIIANIWLQGFSEKVYIGIGLYIICGLVIFAMIELVVIINCMKVSNQNPIDSLKTN